MIRSLTRSLSLVAASALFGLASLPALAQEAGEAAGKSFALELNTLTQAEGACQVYFIAQNNMGVRIENMSFQIVLFDKDGHVSNFLTLKSGALPVGKSRLMQFELKDVTCDSVSGILVNDVTECMGEGLTASACLDALKTSSKASIPLEL